MTPERWRQITELFHAARGRDPAQRDALLADACREDPALQREVAAMLAGDEHAGAFGEAPAFTPPSRFEPGFSLGSYRIERLIGAGGMGEVYRARDMTLGRDVAIKILPQLFTSDPQRLARFEREARTLAALNHPHIGAIYGVEDVEGLQALVLELVEGETLADRLQQGPVPVTAALTLACPIAEALDAAHEKGIIHRDLKPANIKITPDGVVKVLDFGLAKATTGDGSTPDLTQSPTVTVGGTREGMILGTAAYMSPEQARGKVVDKRTDIWAFGCVLYEMLTGRIAFGGETVSDTIAAILEREPDWSRVPASTPKAIHHLLRRCLEKDPKQRWRDIRDAQIELRDALTPEVLPASASEQSRRGPAGRWAAITIVAVAAGSGMVLAIALLLGWGSRHIPKPAETRVMQLEVDPPVGSEFQPDRGVAISPDGHLLAFLAPGAGGDTLWVRALDAPSARQLAGTNGASFPFWSPDSRSIGFFGGGKLWKIEIAGGSPTLICDVPVGRGGTWNADGIILFNAVNDGPLLRVPASGGTPVPLTSVDVANKENSHRWPFFLPDGRRFLYFVRGSAGAGSDAIYEGSLDRPGERTRIRFAPTNAVYAPGENGEGGHLLWVNDQGSLMSQDFNERTGKLSGDPSVLAEGVAFGSASKLGAVSVSSEGTLVYGTTLQDLRQLTWLGRDGRPQGTVGQPDTYRTLRISPDGKRIAVQRLEEISEIEFSRGIPVRVGAGAFTPVWSPDGQQLAYSRGAPVNMFLQTLSGTDHEVTLHQTHDTEIPLDWSPDGRFLLFRLNPNDPSSKTQLDLFLLPMVGDRKPTPLIASPFREWWGRFSPNGRWLAYVSDESGNDEVYVQAFPANGMKWRLSTKGGTAMLWRRDGKEVFYISPDRKIMSVATDDSSRSLEFGPPRPLFSVPLVADQGTSIYTYDVAPDGQRFLVISPTRETGTLPLNVLLHWQRRLQAR
jgi:Tol biopolymer transport system component